MLAKESKIMLIGGHLTPALAVTTELIKRDYNNIVWIGAKYSQTADQIESAEYKVIRGKGIKFIEFKAGKLWRKWTIPTIGKGLFNLFMIPIGFINAVRIILYESPQVVISFGGYLALPIVFAAWLSGVKVFTHEQTVKVGMSNRIISILATRTFFSWPQTSKELPKNALLTGNPIREEILKPGPKEKFIFPIGRPLIYVTGGNQGANTINWRLMKILPNVLEKANVFHQTGNSSLTKDYETAVAFKKTLTKSDSQKYYVCSNVFGDEIGEVFQKADIIISRSGANTVTEILALGKFSILIPIPWSSDNEQLENAKIVESVGLALVVKQYDAMPPEELLEAIEIALDYHSKAKAFNERSMLKARLDAQNLIKLNAASIIVDEITKD